MDFATVASMGNKNPSPPVEPATTEPLEILTDPHRALKLAEKHGNATDKAESSPWSGVDLEILRPHLLRIAAGCLGDQQWQLFAADLAGEKLEDIAKLHSLTLAQADKVLTGAQRKVARAALEDFGFLVDVAASKLDVPDSGELVRQWFRHIRRSMVEQHFVPYAVLLVMFHVGSPCNGALRKLTFADAYDAIPPMCVTAAIPVLKGMGFITTDGVTIVIRKIPVNKAETLDVGGLEIRKERAA